MAVEQLAAVPRQSLASAPTRAWWLENLTLSVVITLGAGVRFFQLGRWSFWPDEVFSFGKASDGFNDSLLHRALATDLIALVVRMLGPSEWSARLVPALIGAATIPLLYWLLRRCMGAPGALLTVALLALSPWHLFWSQNARFYTLLFLFFNLGLLFFYLAIEEDRPWYLAVALLLFGLAARERLVALLGLPALGLYLILLVRLHYDLPPGLNRRNLAIFFGVGAVTCALFLLRYARNIDGWLHGFSRLNTAPVPLAAGTLYYVGLPLALFAVVSGLYLVQRKHRLALLLSLTAVLPLVFLMATSLVQYTANRYGFYALFSWLALAGLGFQTVWRHWVSDARVWSLALAGMLLINYSGELYQYYTDWNGNRDDWRAAFAYIADHGRAGDRVTSSSYEIFQYYLGDRYVFQPWAAQMDDACASPGARTWYIVDRTVGERLPGALAGVDRAAGQQAAFDVQLPGRAYPMRVYLADCQAGAAIR